MTDPARVRGLRLSLAYHGGAVVYLNGKELARHFDELDGWRTPEVLDLQPAIRAGANLLTVDAADGTSAQGFIAEGVIGFADGTEQPIRSDRSWQAALEPNGPWRGGAGPGARAGAGAWGGPPTTQRRST